MLLSFKVKNYLSFKDEAGFSMEANKKIRTLSENKNIIKLKDGETLWLLKTAIFYGANASGKTNIFKGLDLLKDITLNSFKFGAEIPIKKQLTPGIFFNHFLLQEESLNEYSDFEIEFLIDKVRFKYFLRLNEKEILKEKLSYFKNGKEKIILNRQITKWQIEEEYFGFKEDDFERLNLFPKSNQTFISIFANRETGEYNFTKDNKIIKSKKNIGLSTKIRSFFLRTNILYSKSDFSGMTMGMLKEEKYKKTILSFMNNADINIEDITQNEKEVNMSKYNNGGFVELNGQKIKPQKIVEVKTNFIHPIYKDGMKISNTEFDFLNQESQGTQKLFSLLGPILTTINDNGILLIDEVDTHMHFLLIENLINFIHGLNDKSKNNIGNSQFVFNTHNLDLLDLNTFRKDQIYFTSKDNYGATEMYSLDDFKDIQIRNNSDIKKAYKLGVFGAVPILSDFNL